MASLEDAEQIAIIDWAKLYGIHYHDLIHVPNGGSRNLFEAKKLKRMGVRRGVSDLMLLIPHNGFNALFIELKQRKKKGKQIRVSKEQKEFLERKNSQGYKSVICFGAAEAIDEIKRYLNE